MKTMKTGITGTMLSRGNPAKDNMRDYFSLLNELSARSEDYYTILHHPLAIRILYGDDSWKRGNAGFWIAEAGNMQKPGITCAAEMTVWL